ncbi:helix-turn-helix transcriptional regulator [Desulfoluna spongiiphila]|uniref:helix-turn-helix transcriptional regulator n=1 Tax=Desulfoluna spongiiphila TaxID=419481 RepID=UPI001255ACFA|nr:AraC family transcriptional regulator [Desulfoluna spongiiphila]VVS94951.1 transcription regulator hth arac- type [Desulfoluna spongiiphila]
MRKSENTTFYRHHELKGIEVTRAIESHHIFPKHAHDNTYTLVLADRGASYCVGPEEHEAVVDRQSVALINPAQVHSGIPIGREQLSYWSVNIMLDVMTASFRDVSGKDAAAPEFKRMVVRDPVLQGHLLHFFHRMTMHGGRLSLETALLESLGHLLIRYGNAQTPEAFRGESHRVCRAKEYLSEELGRKMSLDEVAEAVGLSRYHFLRVFKNATGIAPHAFRTQRRIDLSQRLIRQGMPFSQVALETGFSDQSHFTKRFKQFTGATPRQYMINL